MEYEAGDYQKLQIKQYPPRTIRETAEGKYWKRFKAPTVTKEVGGAATSQRAQIAALPAPNARRRPRAPMATQHSAAWSATAQGTTGSTALPCSVC